MLYIIRHGQTEWNALHKLQGRTDIPLNNIGRDMAKRAALEAANINFDICYSSPLIRAKETAEIILKDRNIPIITDDRLKEMSFGIYEGIQNYFEDSNCPVNIIFKHPELYTTAFENAESFEDLFSRTGEFLNDKIYPFLNQGKDILIVGHGAMNLSIICQVKQIPLKDFWSTSIENCKLFRLI